MKRYQDSNLLIKGLRHLWYLTYPYYLLKWGFRDFKAKHRIILGIIDMKMGHYYTEDEVRNILNKDLVN